MIKPKDQTRKPNKDLNLSFSAGAMSLQDSQMMPPKELGIDSKGSKTSRDPQEHADQQFSQLITGKRIIPNKKLSKQDAKRLDLKIQ